MSSDRIPFDTATTIIKEFKSRARFYFADSRVRFKIIPAGSYRRKKETLKDIDLLIIYSKKYARYGDKILKSLKLDDKKNSQIQSFNPNPKMQGTAHSQFKITARGPLTARDSLTARDRIINLDLFLVSEGSLPFALFHYTGGKEFNIRTRAHAKRNGILLNQYGMFDQQSGKKINAKIKTERDIFKYLGITYKSPKQR